MRLISGGFFVTRILQKPEGLGTLLPELLLTLSSCLTDLLPDTWAFDWVSNTESERRARVEKLGLDPELLPLISRTADSALAADELGWPHVWRSLPAAQSFLSQEGIAGQGFLLLELGVPEDFVATLLRELVPGPHETPCGIYSKLQSADAVQASAVPLGWELLGVEPAGYCHSWLCNSLQDEAAQQLRIRPGSLGLLESEQSARAMHQLIKSGIGAAPVPWLPGLLSRIT